jgi:hypothetical protein
VEQNITDKLATAWWKHFRNQRVTVREVIFLAMRGGEGASDLREVLEVIAQPTYPGLYSSHRLGYWLTKEPNLNALTLPFKFMDRGTPTTATGRYWQLLPNELSRDEEDVLPTETFAASL